VKIKGNRTYVASAGIVLAAVGGFLSGEMTLYQAIGAGLGGLGLAGLRAGVSNDAGKKGPRRASK
jgi:hypothetical protein